MSQSQKLNTICECAFFNTSIENISIPSSVTELKDGWCIGTKELDKVTIMANNQCFRNYDDHSLVLGKSDLNSKEYDSLIFASKKRKTIKIPPNIKIIGSYSFNNCSIKNIFIPASIQIIRQFAFGDCKQLRTIEIAQDSQLQRIEQNAFLNSSIESFSFPTNFNNIDLEAFNNCQQLQIIEINSDFRPQFSYSILSIFKQYDKIIMISNISK